MIKTSKLTIFFYVILALTIIQNRARAGEYTDVIDAFDNANGDPFDINISIGYIHKQEKGTITRETLNTTYLHSWDYYPKYKFGKYDHSQNILDLNLDMGLFRDLSFRFGLPIILSDDRSITPEKGWILETGQSELFSSSFTSPQRSGIDYLSAGLWWNILDQTRKKAYPFLTVFIEGRFGVGSPLKAACANAGDSFSDCTSASATTDGGISENMNQLHMGLKFSRRYGIIEPYMGIDAMVGWYKNKDFTMGSGALNDMPPMRGTFDFGMEITPWEVPSEFRKFVISFGGSATYVSEGRAYTPLFDALGTSKYFTIDGNADIDDSGSTGDHPDEATALASWNGMTDVENYGVFYGTLDFTIQPAKYVKFNLGVDLGHQTEHFITKTDQCPAGKVVGGVCQEYNLGHRPEIDKPGSRFRVENTFVWALQLNAIAQF